MPLTTTQQEQIIEAAHEAAQMFVDDFAEPLDPLATDWDDEAWAADKKHIDSYDTWTHEESQEAWLLYEHTLVNKTEELCEGTEGDAHA